MIYLRMSINLGKKFLSQKNFKDAEEVFQDLNKNNNNFEILLQHP